MLIGLKTIVNGANAIAEPLTENATQVRHMVERHNVVIGTWQDPKEDGSVGTYIVRGGALGVKQSIANCFRTNRQLCGSQGRCSLTAPESKNNIPCTR